MSRVNGKESGGNFTCSIVKFDDGFVIIIYPTEISPVDVAVVAEMKIYFHFARIEFQL